MVYILSKVDTTGREMFVGQFPTQGAALDIIVKNSQYEISVQGSTTYVQFASPKYCVRQMDDNPTPVTVDYKINSMSDWNKAYVVTVEKDTQKAVRCTCPDHEHRKSFCKHMRHVKVWGTGGLQPVLPVIPPLIPESSSQAVVPVKPFPPHSVASRTISVQSETDWRTQYLVSVDLNGYPIGCNCPHYTHRKETCKHMRKIAMNMFKTN